MVDVFDGDDNAVNVVSELGVLLVVYVDELSDIFDVEFSDIFDVGKVDIFDVKFVCIFSDVDKALFGPAITTGWIFSLIGCDAFLVSFIIFVASFLRFSICFSVVSTILDSTIASNNWTPVT